MDVREKMIEILKQAPFEGKVLDEWWWEEKIKRIADHLISNCVTVQEWIPVDERLPQDGGAVCKDVILFMDSGLVTVGWLNQITNRGYYLDTINDVIIKAPLSRFTHWMPLPEPPKGE